METPRRMLLLGMLPIGDTLWLTPTVRALRQRFPGARLTLLTSRQAQALARHIPELDETLTLPRLTRPREWPALLRTLRWLRAQRFDAAVTFTTPAYKWISWFCRIPRRSYLKWDPLWWLVPYPHPRWRTTHATRHYYDCARELRLPAWGAVSHTPRLALPEDASRAARAFLGEHLPAGAPAGAPLIALHPGGAGLHGLKRWPAERFAALADQLAERRGATIVLLGGPDERALAEEVAARMRRAPLIAAGALPLMASVALIEVCGLFIGNDSGLLHLAAARGVPFVGVFGPTALANFHPIPAFAGQGAVVTPPIPCPEPVYFVGGEVIWRRRACAGTCRALETLAVGAVLERAEALLRDARDQAGAELAASRA